MARRRSTAARRSATPEPDGQWLDASGRVIDEEDRGLVYDLATLVSKRSAQGLEGENYLRGVQSVDADGTVEFTSVYPAAYDGRWPHIHFEVYDGVDTATSSGPIVKTSQIALPQETCEAVYATSGYEASVANLARTSLTSDMVFGDDGGIHQIASMAGTVKTGYTAALTIAV
jgi:protocatechuate 3,4-dioxygenase beta subunit